MIATVHPSQPKGLVNAPASKSLMQRACAAALIRKGRTVLHNPGMSADDKAAMRIIRQLGADVNVEGEAVIITSTGIQPKQSKLHCGESGLSFRLFTTLAAITPFQFTITGEGSLLQRPAHFFETVLPQLGVLCNSNNGLLPLSIRGPLQAKNITVDGGLSSQFLTGLLFAYSALQASECTITVKDLKSRPYIDLSLDVLEKFGLMTPVNNNYEEFYFPEVNPDTTTATDLHYTVEGDWSNAAFLLVAGAIAGDVVIKELDAFSKQADKSILQPLMQAGALLSIEATQVQSRKAKLTAFHFDATHCPDLFPPLVALAAYCDGTSVIEGVHRLKHKESDRAAVLVSEFSKLGIDISLQDDLMIIRGGPVSGGSVSSHNDHRIAMALAIAATGADSMVSIEGAGAVSKSYPQFWQHLKELGINVSLTDNPLT